MDITKVDGQLPVQAPTKTPTQSTTQQPPRQNPLPDSITPEKSDECCLVKIWDTLCRFFKWVCSCLCGRSKEGAKPLDRTAVIAAGAGFMKSYRKYMNSKEHYKNAVKAFADLQPQVQWQVLHLMVPREELRQGDRPLGHISTYIAASEKLAKEVCEGLNIDSVKQLRETSELDRDLRKDLCLLLKRKVGIEAPAPSGTQTPQDGGQPTEKKPFDKPENKSFDKPDEPPKAVMEFLAQKDQTKWFNSGECDNLSRAQILLYMAKEESNIDNVKNYLADWVNIDEVPLEQFTTAIGVEAIGLIQAKHRTTLIAFFEAFVKQFQG